MTFDNYKFLYLEGRDLKKITVTSLQLKNCTHCSMCTWETALFIRFPEEIINLYKNALDIIMYTIGVFVFIFVHIKCSSEIFWDRIY